MKECNDAKYLREELEQMSTQQLDELLGAELGTACPDGKTVRLILSVLKKREAGYPAEMTPEINRAWAKYSSAARKRNVKRYSFLLKAASIALVAVVLFAVLPREAEAKSFFERLACWTDSFFELFSPGQENDNRAEYEFQTDNPGLQEVYDTLAELGVTVPVVPMWLPEGYELTECKVMDTPSKTEVYATFEYKDNKVTIKIEIYNGTTANKYYKDESVVSTYEAYGINHYIMRNNDTWVVIWTRDNLECSIAIDCPEDTLYRIFWSIYTMEDR